MTTIRILFIAGILLFLGSCNNISCSSSGFSISYSGFDSTELSALIVNKYEPSNGFSKLVDADTLDLNDSVNSVIWVSHAVSLNGNYDWELTLLYANRTDRITELSMRETTGDRSAGKASSQCYNGWDYKLNGVKSSTPTFGGEFGSDGPQMPVITK